MRKFLVYKHTSPIGKSYIGITSQNPIIRWANGNGYSGQPKFFNAITKYGWDNFTHEILYSDLTEQEAYKTEKELIEKFNSITNGYNSSIGGEYANLGNYKYKIGDVISHFKIIGREERKLLLQCLECGNILSRYPGKSFKEGKIKCCCKIHYNPNPKPKKIIYIKHNGQTKTVKQWSEELNIPKETIIYRYKKGYAIDVSKHRDDKTKHCEYCGKTFYAKIKRQKFCCEECAHEAAKINRPILVCNYCGKEFKPNRALNDNYKGLFCSIQCRIDFNKAR